MKVRVSKPEELSRDELKIWSALQRADPTVASPFFCHGYTLAVSRVRPDIFVGVIEDENQIVGFFPFQLQRQAIGRPVGRSIADLQGIIVAKGVEWTMTELIRGCGLKVYSYHGFLADQMRGNGSSVQTKDSYQIDLSAGYEAYAAARRAAGSKLLQQTARKERQLERDFGQLTYKARNNVAETLDTLIGWKRDQYLRLGEKDIFDRDWSVRLLHNLQLTETPDFAGMFSTLHAGHRLVAAHLGMRSQTVWNLWFPSYDVRLKKYSPGMVLQKRMAQSAEELGISRFDLGAGDYPYKLRLATNQVQVTMGYEGVRSVPLLTRNLRRATENLFESLPLGKVASWPAQVFRRFIDMLD
jgi:CelD/BcsL family acetyltransferase involved in cellulose biosynthesis